MAFTAAIKLSQPFVNWVDLGLMSTFPETKMGLLFTYEPEIVGNVAGHRKYKGPFWIASRVDVI
jgi:hypothetical protein